VCGYFLEVFEGQLILIYALAVFKKLKKDSE
jgi:hypothetical protein